MEVKVFDSVTEASREALELFQSALNDGAKTFGLATGSTPEKLYELMRGSSIDFSQATSINLDEYYGLASDHPQSYNYYMHKQLFDAKPFAKNYLPDGTNENAQEERARYNQIIADNPIDLQLLGIGENGHVGFNEPGSSFDSHTRLVDLTDSTIQANKRFFDSEADVPKQAYSMGLADIMSADQVILMAFGAKKAWAVNQMVNGPVTEDVPASILQKHDNVVVIVDREAAPKES